MIIDEAFASQRWHTAAPLLAGRTPERAARTLEAHPRGAGAMAVDHFVPPIEMVEIEGWICIRAELPGVSERDIEVAASSGGLTLSGRKFAVDRRVADSFRSERAFGMFSRMVSLPKGADLLRASAWLKDGVLEIDIPVAGSPSE